MNSRIHTFLILFVALVVRFGAWWTLPYNDWISDEGEYWAAAVWLAEGRGFAFFDGWIWTRPPMYVLFLAAHVKLFGSTALWAPRLTQALLSTLMVWLTMRVGRRLAPAGRSNGVAYGAGWLMALSYSFASFAFFLLSETLFLTLFLSAVLLLLRWADSRLWFDLLLGGVVLGLCTLTRSITLTWLPLVALWIVWVARSSTTSGWRRWRAGLVAGVALTIMTIFVVAPWSLYATQRWGSAEHIILVDTTGGYNWALGAQSATPAGRHGIKLHDFLCEGAVCDPTANHGERQARAYALGWSLIAEHPMGFVRKSGREFLDMVQLQYGGAERIRGGYTSGAVPAPHLLGLLGDDSLYVLVLVLGLMGLFRVQARPGKSLVLSWLLYNLAVGALVFAINRFRQPLFPFLAIYAACALVQWRLPWSKRRFGSYALVAIMVYITVLPSYVYWPPLLDADRRSVWQDTLVGFTGLRNATECAQIEQVLQAGAIAEARSLHDAAHARQGRQCLARIHARLLVAEGRLEAALNFLTEADPENNALLASRILMIEGDIRRSIGDLEKAQEVFTNRDVEIVNDTTWAWDNLQPPPASTIDVGSGLDYGYIEGFYQRERGDPSFRWSGAQARLRFPEAGTGAPQTLVLRVNGYTINADPTQLTAVIDGAATAPIVLAPDWQEVTIALPAAPAGADVVVELRSTVFVPGPADLAQRVRDRVAQPLRLLGFQLDWAALQ